MHSLTVIYPKGNLSSNKEERYPIEVEAGEEQDILAQVFRMMNRVDSSPVEHYLDQYQIRSMSVGDIVEFADGKRFRCEAVGWEQI